jgi:integration host factor subunit alpha
MALTKTEVIQQVQNKTGMTKKESMAGVDALFEIIKNELSHGKPIKISGFGKWTVMEKKARNGRNPQTGKAMTITARKVVTFRPSYVLRKILAK